MIRAQIKFVPGAHLKHSDLTVQWWNTSLLPSFLSPLKVICALETTSGISIWSIAGSVAKAQTTTPTTTTATNSTTEGYELCPDFECPNNDNEGGLFSVFSKSTVEQRCTFKLNIFSLAPVVLTSVNALTVFSLRLINCIRAKRWRSCFLFVRSKYYVILFRDAFYVDMWHWSGFQWQLLWLVSYIKRNK